jgi:hypothetical protein
MNRRDNVRAILVAGALAVLGPPAAAAESWRPLPLVENGQVAGGWKHVGFGKLVVDGDAVRTECDERGLGLAVWTKEKLGNCQIRVVFRTKDRRSNAGVIIRLDDGILDWIGKDSIAVSRDMDGRLSPEMLARMQEASEKEQGAWYAVHHGYEVQICDTGDGLHRTGAVYSLAPAAEAAQPAAAEGNPAWRTMIITLDGNLVRVEVDGKQLTQFDPASEKNPPRKAWHEPKREHRRPEAGYIGLQTHDPGDEVWFKAVSVRPLGK